MSKPLKRIITVHLDFTISMADYNSFKLYLYNHQNEKEWMKRLHYQISMHEEDYDE